MGSCVWGQGVGGCCPGAGVRVCVWRSIPSGTQVSSLDVTLLSRHCPSQRVSRRPPRISILRSPLSGGVPGGT